MYTCPNCKKTNSIKISVITKATLIQLHDGQGGFLLETSQDDPSQSWDRNSIMSCACGFYGPARQFEKSDAELFVVTINHHPVVVEPKTFRAEGLIRVPHAVMRNHEVFLDSISEALVGHDMLMAIGYEVVSANGGFVGVFVSGHLELDYWRQMLEKTAAGQSVKCCECAEKTLAATAHEHCGEIVGDECCWEP